MLLIEIVGCKKTVFFTVRLHRRCFDDRVRRCRLSCTLELKTLRPPSVNRINACRSSKTVRPAKQAHTRALIRAESVTRAS